MSDPSIDLLGQKRVELGLPLVQSAPLPAGRLLLKGGLVAGVLVIVAAIAAWMLVQREQQLNASVVTLTPYANQADQLQATLGSVRSRTSELQANVASMTQRLVSIRSGSAFLEQLKRVTPASVQLRNVSVGVSQVEIKGVSQQSLSTVGPLEQINAFSLNLEGLAGVPDEGAVLQRVSRSETGPVEFQLLLRVDPSHQPTAEELSGLGAEGLARRHQLLRRRGLPL